MGLEKVTGSSYEKKEKTTAALFWLQPHVSLSRNITVPCHDPPGSLPARGEEMTYLPVCSPEALPEPQCPDPGLQSAQQKQDTNQ